MASARPPSPFACSAWRARSATLGLGHPVSVIRLRDREVAQRSGRVGLEYVAQCRQLEGIRPDLLKEPQASCGAKNAVGGVRVGAGFLRYDGARQRLLGEEVRDAEAAE